MACQVHAEIKILHSISGLLVTSYSTQLVHSVINLSFTDEDDSN